MCRGSAESLFRLSVITSWTSQSSWSTCQIRTRTRSRGLIGTSSSRSWTQLTQITCPQCSGNMRIRGLLRQLRRRKRWLPSGLKCLISSNPLLLVDIRGASVRQRLLGLLQVSRSAPKGRRSVLWEKWLERLRAMTILMTLWVKPVKSREDLTKSKSFEHWGAICWFYWRDSRGSIFTIEVRTSCWLTYAAIKVLDQLLHEAAVAIKYSRLEDDLRRFMKTRIEKVRV